MLGYGFHSDVGRWVSAGAGLLLFTTLASLANGAVVLRRSRTRAPVDRAVR
jgi:hypothetical protein